MAYPLPFPKHGTDQQQKCLYLRTVNIHPACLRFTNLPMHAAYLSRLNPWKSHVSQTGRQSFRELPSR